MSQKESKIRRVLSLLSVAALTVGCVGLQMPTAETKAETTYPFQDTSLSFEERAADIVSRLTLEEKVAQIGNNNPAVARLGIAKYDYWKEGLHGVANLGEGQTATSFPYSIAMAATWDKDLMNEVGTAISDEARGYNNQGLRGLSYWSPTINLARDPRWGRNHESYGEDVFLTSALGSEFVNGYQGNGENKYLKVISTLKHYAANNSEYNRHFGTSDATETYLREYYTRTFKNIVQETGINQVMSSYNRINGTPASANTWLLDTLLRKTFGFRGYVVSDCGAIQNMTDDHKWTPEGADHSVTFEEATMYGLTAGCDMDCGSVYPHNALSAVKSGILSEDVIDRSLLRIFTARMKTGEFDPAEDVPYRSEEYSYKNQVENKEHVQLAEDSADQTIVLLKNEKAAAADTAPILPLDPEKSQKVVMVGNLASQNLLGGYSGTPSKENLSTPLQGVESLLGHEVTYINGGTSSTGGYVCNSRNVKLIKEGGQELVLAPTDIDKTNKCRVENNTNVGYIEPNAYVMYKDVDITKTKTIAIETSGGGDTLQGTVEIHIDSPDGMLLTKIAISQTGGWGNYQYFQNTVSSLGGYETKDLYVVFTPETDVEKEVTFTADEEKAIKEADVVIACIGSQGGDSSESHDRSTIEMPRSQDIMVKSLARLNSRTVAYIQSVGVLEIGEFKDSVPAILWTCYNGQAQGNAIARVLFGQRNPGAKLPFTWYSKDSQLPTIDDYNLYDESYSNGGWTYQYFTGDVDYPFGYGLSYSSFAYSNLITSAGTSIQMGDVNGRDGVTAEDALMALQAATKKITLTAAQEKLADVNGKDGVTAEDALMILQAATKKITLPVIGDGSSVTPNDIVTVTVDVKNTSKVDGEEVVQLYLSTPGANGTTRPFKQLKAFEKVALKAGESKTVTLTVDMKDCYFWNEEEQKNVYDKGTYTFFVGPSSDKESGLAGSFTVDGEFKPELSVVTAKQDKVVLNAARPDKVLTTELTTAMSDDSFYDLSAGKATITYKSNRPEVATVDAKGVVTPAGEGVATITVSVTIDGVTKTDSYAVAVINELKIDEILLDGEKMEIFEPGVTEYYYPVDGDKAPVVSVPDVGNQVKVEITQADSVTGTATVKVSYGSDSITYTIHFKPSSSDYVVARFSAAEGRYTASKSALGTGTWKTVDGGQPVDTTSHFRRDLYLNMTIVLTNGEEGLKDTEAFKNGYVKLSSVDVDGKENNRGWSVGSLKLHSGVNYVSIPLSRMSEITETGSIDWTKINRFNMYIDSVNKYEGPFTMLLQDVVIVDTRFEGTRQHLQALVDENVSQDDYTPATYAEYNKVKQAAQAVLGNSSATAQAIEKAIDDLLAAKEQLERKVDKAALKEAIEKPVDESLYTADSVARYKAVLEEAKKVLNNDNATQNEVDTALQNLNTARGKLKKPNTEPVLATFNRFNKEYSAQAGNWNYGSTLYADWTTAENAPIDLDGDRTGLYLIMNMSFKAPAGTDLSKCWESATIKLRSTEKNGENNYGWVLKPNSPEVKATATPGEYKIAIPLTKKMDNTKGTMDWGAVEKVITTTVINSVGDYRVQAGKSDLTMTLAETKIVDSAIFDLNGWFK